MVRRLRKGIAAAAAAARTSQASKARRRPSSPSCSRSSSPSSRRRRNRRQQQTARHHQNQPRKKKKFFQKSSAPAAQPGNSIAGPSQGKRKGKQRGPREFVGPMDHSYRAVNGNVADGPPSTIQILSNNHGSYYPDAYAPAAAARPRRRANAHLLLH